MKWLSCPLNRSKLFVFQDFNEQFTGLRISRICFSSVGVCLFHSCVFFSLRYAMHRDLSNAGNINAMNGSLKKKSKLLGYCYQMLEIFEIQLEIQFAFYLLAACGFVRVNVAFALYLVL